MYIKPPDPIRYSTLWYADLKMYVPAPGWIFNRLTGEWEKRPVYKRHPDPEQQFFSRTLLPRNFKMRTTDEIARREIDPSYVDEELEKFRRREWDRRLNGFWFMNKGVPTYITGPHYFYLCYYYIKNKDNGGYPEYWDSDRLWFYFAQYCEQDPDCYGFIYLVKRRAGKTQKAGCLLLEAATSMMNFNAGIQSKTEKDASDVVFKSSIVNAFKRLPNFFKPIFDTVAGDTPKKILEFRRTAQKGKNAMVLNQEYDDLNSSVSYRSSGVWAYDGEKLQMYYGDEVFKTPVDVYERHRVHRPCVEDSNGRVDGLMIYTSTCEEIGDMISEYVKMWNDSDQKNKDPDTNRTVSGLYRLFTPSSHLMNRDIYGFCDAEANEKIILNNRKAVEGQALAELVRKTPLTVEEAFRSASRNCLFNEKKLQDRLDVLNFTDNLYETGYYRWANRTGKKLNMKDIKEQLFNNIGDRIGEDDLIPNSNGLNSFQRSNIPAFHVEWVPDPKGPFKIKKGAILEQEEANNCRVTHHGLEPLNGHMYTMGMDTFDHYSKEISDERKKSDGAFYLFCKYDPNHTEWANTPLVEYAARKDLPQEFYEDAIMCAIYWGAKILFETQKITFRHYVEEYRLMSFLLWMPNAKGPGIASSPGSKQMAAEFMMSYVENYVENINFAGLVNDALKFEIENTKRYDRMMAFLWTLVAAHIFNLKPKNTKEAKLTHFFRRYKVR